MRGQRRGGRRWSRRPRRAHGAKVALPLERLRLRRRQAAARTSSPTCPAPISAYGRSKQAGETSVAIANPRHFIVRSSWLFGTGGAQLRRDDAADRPASSPRCVVVSDQVGTPDLHPHLAAALARLIEGEEFGIHHIAAGGQCSWYEFAQEIFDQAGVECRVMSGTTEMLGRPAPRPAYSVLGSERPDPIALPDWRQGLAEYLAARARAAGAAGVNVLVTGGAGFIGSAYVRHRLDDASRATRSGCSTSSPTRAGARTSTGSTRGAARAGRGRHRRPRTPSRAALDGLRRDRQLRRRDARRPLDRRTRASSSRPTSSGPSCCSRPRATPASATSRSRPTRSTARSRTGSFTERSPLDPSSPYSASKAGGDLIVGAFRHTYGADALIVRALEQLRPAPVSGEADPALRPQRARRRPAARLRRRHAGPQLALGRGLRARDRHRARVRRGGRGLQRRRPRRAAQHRGRRADPRADRPRRVADRARRRPPRPRPPLLALVGEDPRRSAGRPRSASTTGIERTVEWYRDNEWWWEPIRSGEYRELLRAPLRLGAAADARARSRRELDGLVLLEPEVHGDERGFLVETFSEPSWRELGVEAEFVQDNHSRSGAGHPARAALPDHARPGEARPLPAGTDLGRRRRPAPRLADLRPVGGPRARRRAPPPALRPGRLRARLLRAQRASPTSHYKLSSLYDPATEAGIAWDDPEVGVEWPIVRARSSPSATAPPRGWPRSPTSCRSSVPRSALAYRRSLPETA